MTNKLNHNADGISDTTWRWITIVGATIIAILFIVMILNPLEGGGSDDGRPFDDEPATAQTVEVNPVTDQWLDNLANEAYLADPIGICRDVTLMDEQAALTLIKAATEDNQGVTLSDTQAARIYNFWIGACS